MMIMVPASASAAKWLLLAFFIFAAIAPTLQAFNDDLSVELMESVNSTRRQLAKRTRYQGPCKATNVIDRCWRCDPNWAKNRKRLADCAMGLGKNTIGGKMGRFYEVTDPSDDDVVNPKYGTLRWGAIQKEPLWITFKRSMIIRLKQELMVTSFKTIDGRGANVHIAGGAGITLQFVSNVIIHGLFIHNIVVTNGGMIRDSANHFGLRAATDGDGIIVFGSRNIWIDHISMSRCADGLIDVLQAATDITISNCHFTDHDKVMLFGANDLYSKDKDMRITVAFTHFGKRLVQRMPRCRYGFFHLVNNDYTHWKMYAIGGSQGATIISQGNRFIAQKNDPLTYEVTHRVGFEKDWPKWTWFSRGDVFQNHAFFRPSGDPRADRTFAKLELIRPEPGNRVGELTKFAGALGCKVGKPC